MVSQDDFVKRLQSEWSTLTTSKLQSLYELIKENSRTEGA